METHDDKNQLQEQDISNLSRSERRKLRKQQRRDHLEAERGKRKRKRIIKRIGAISIILLIIILLFLFRGYGLKDAPSLIVTPATYDFGSVSQAEGSVSASLTIENKGKNDLIITGMESSCGCTTASIINDGVKSPIFGMHNNPTDWLTKIESGKNAELKINYNPNVHKELRGLVTRSVFIYSNDPKNGAKEVVIRATQVD